jgi:hypothetical protein
MKYRLQRQEIHKDLFIFCSHRIKKNKIDVPRASKKIVTELPSILKDIQKKGLPNYLVIKKLQGKLGHGIFLHPEASPILKGSPIAPYSGEVILCPQNIGNDSDYTFSLISDLHLSRQEQKKWDPSRPYHQDVFIQSI